MSSPSPAYIAYTPKRHSTQTSIASLSQVQAHLHQSPSPSPTPPSPSPAPSSRSHSHARPERAEGVQSPQPRRLDARPPLANHWTSSSSAASSRSPHPLTTHPAPPSPEPRRNRTPQAPPYIPAFQPAGVRRDRTEQFLASRRNKRNQVRGDEERLERRLDKLLDLHFPSPSPSAPTSPPAPVAQPRSSSLVSSLSSLTDSLFSSSSSNPASPVVGAGPPGSSSISTRDLVRVRVANPTLSISDAHRQAHLELAEQRLVKWESDRLVKHCRVCSVEFGFLTRKHHCRLCGRIVCFLPPTRNPPPSSPPPPLSDNEKMTTGPASPPVRRERCSTFLTYVVDEQSALNGDGDGDEDAAAKRRARDSTAGSSIRQPPRAGNAARERRRDGIVVEVKPVEEDVNAKTVDAVLSGLMADSAANIKGDKRALAAAAKEPQPKKDERKKVRVCRECLDTVLRLQLSTLPLDTPTWLQLYRVLKQLELEIDALLVEFQQLAIDLQQSHSLSQLGSTSSEVDEIGRSTSSSRPRPSVSQTASLRARLLTNLASYDTLSKRLLSLASSSSSPPPSSASVANPSEKKKNNDHELERLEKALGTRASNWLSDKLALLRQLGSIEEISGSTTTMSAKGGGGGNKGKNHHRHQSSSSLVARDGKDEDDGRVGGGGVKSLESLLSRDELRKVRERVGDIVPPVSSGEPDDDGDGPRGDEAVGNGQLGVLLEQEKLVQSYLEDANARRQFEDAASLQASLDELRREIDRLSVS